MTSAPEIPRDTERRLLGSAIMWPHLLDQLDVQAPHFGVPAHGRLWGLLRRLRDEGRRELPFDVLLDLIGLEGNPGAAEPYGGLELLLALPSQATIEEHAPAYARQVLDGHARRTVYGALWGALEVIADPQADPAALAASLAATAREAAVVDHDTWILHADGLQEAVDRAIEAASSGTPSEVFRVGIPEVDEVLQLRRGQLVVVAGRPGTGKSAALLQSIENIATYYGAVGVLSLEMGHGELAERTLARESGVPLGRISMGVDITPSDVRAMQEVADRARGIPLYVDQGTSATIGVVRAKAERLRQRRPDLVCIAVDYLQLMRDSAGAENEAIRLGVITRELKLMAKELGILVILLSQLNRESEKGTGQEPRIAELRGSGSIEQDADAVVLLWEQPGGEMSAHKGEIQWHVAKQRKGPKGGKVWVKWEGAYQRFGERRRDARVYEYPRGGGG